jgi:hypothetical protein
MAAASTSAPDFDNVMRLVYTHPAHATLYEDIWGEIARFTPRDALLNLRATDSHMAAWVDREITTLKVTAANAPAMLNAVGRATHLKYIERLRIEECNDRNFPPVIAALAQLPHARFNLVIAASWVENLHLTAVSLLLLRDLTPASLKLCCGIQFTHAEAEALAQLRYPVSIQGAFLTERPQEQLALASIPVLTNLSIWPHWLDEEGARALSAHPRLTELRILSAGGASISDAALVSIAGSERLRALRVGPTRNVIGMQAFAALADNCTLEILKIGNTGRPVDPALVHKLSTNTTLQALDIAVDEGCGYLAKMVSLQDLTLRCNLLTLDDARMFLQHAHLKRLTFVFNPRFEGGALGTIAGSDVTALSIAHVAPTADDIQALLANRCLRSLDMALMSDFAETVALTRMLAAHPTLTELTVYYKKTTYEAPKADRLMTQQERTAMLAAWGDHRSTGSLVINF